MVWFKCCFSFVVHDLVDIDLLLLRLGFLADSCVDDQVLVLFAGRNSSTMVLLIHINFAPTTAQVMRV